MQQDTTVDTNYHIGRGALKLANRDANGTPGPLTDVGEVMISIEITKEYKSNSSTRHSVAEKDAHVPVSQEVKGTITLKERTAKNLELYLHGTTTENAAQDVAAAAFPAGVQVGEIYRLPGFSGSIADADPVTIVDSAVAPHPLVEGTDYTVDRRFGTVKFLAVVGKTQPFKASFHSAASRRSSFLTKKVINKFLHFEGENIGNNTGSRYFLDELYNCTLMPAKKLDEKSDDFATYEIDFECLADPTKAEDPELGRFGNSLEL